MSLSVPYIVLVAKQLEIEDLKRLKARSHLVGVIGHMIHVLQSERGASSIYLASKGKRFGETRLALINEAESVETSLRQIFENELRYPSLTNTKIISLMAWVILGLDALPDIRDQINSHKRSGSESVAAFSRLIAGLIALVFELTDAAADPSISKLLVGLLNLVEGKELAGQERAVGALAFGSGSCDDAIKQRIIHLIDAQEQNFRIFLEFVDDPVITSWQKMENMPFITELQRLRGLLRAANPNKKFDPSLSDTWFQCCSERITEMWTIQSDLVDNIQQQCDNLISKAERELLDSEGLLKTLRDKPPARAGAIDRFFDPDLPLEQSMNFRSSVNEGSLRAHSLIELLQAQSQHLANMENELASAKRALNERKIVEQAKGILMARHNISGDEAYKKMRTASMQQNRRLLDIAESVLSLTSLS